MLDSFFHNMTLMIFLVLVTVKVNDKVAKKYDSLLWGNILLILVNGIMGVLLMLDPIQVSGMHYDLRSVPIFISAYLGGWISGILTAVFSLVYRLFLHEVFWVDYLISFALPVIVGALFAENVFFGSEKIHLKKVFSIYSLYFVIKALIAVSILPISLEDSLILLLNNYVFSIIPVLCISLIINESIQNVQMQKEIEERNIELLAEKERMQRYLDVAEVIFIILDQDHKIRLINQKGAEVFGFQISELLDKRFSHFVKYEDLYRIEKIIQNITQDHSEKIGQCECTIVNKSLEEIEILWTCTIFPDDQGQIEGFLLSGIDITKRKILQNELEYNKLITQFFANLSHEMRTPLNLMFSAVQMINRQQTGCTLGGIDKYTQIIKQNIYRMLKLVDNIIDVTRINSKQFIAKKQPCDIVQLLEKITDAVDDHITERGRILHYQSDLTRQLILCDPILIERAILNLVSNALKFTEPKDEITIKLSRQDDSILIAVTDTGLGIPKDKQKIVFERFRQVDKSFRRIHEGSGLGLYIVKLITELHDGSIKLTSEFGDGSEFVICLPIGNISGDEQEFSFFAQEDTIDRVDIELSDIYG